MSKSVSGPADFANAAMPCEHADFADAVMPSERATLAEAVMLCEHAELADVMWHVKMQILMLCYHLKMPISLML